MGYRKNQTTPQGLQQLATFIAPFFGSKVKNVHRAPEYALVVLLNDEENFKQFRDGKLSEIAVTGTVRNLWSKVTIDRNLYLLLLKKLKRVRTKGCLMTESEIKKAYQTKNIGRKRISA